MYYHFVILLLFRPFIKLEIVGSSVSPYDVCKQAADAIAALANSYSQLYTLRRTPAFVPYFVLTSSITHLVVLGMSGGGTEHISQGIAHLKVMAECHGFARKAGEILTFLAHDWEIDAVYAEDDDEADPKSLGRPRSNSGNLFAPNVELKDIFDGMNPVKANKSPLFRPFPFQGRPVIGEGESLRRAGFKILKREGCDTDVKLE